jgi:hypothetical protein
MSWVGAIESRPEESRAEYGAEEIHGKSNRELMKSDRRFDEVMIVNPYDPASSAGEGANVMQFHYAPGYGYYAASPYGYYGAASGYGAWGSEWPGVSGYAQDPMSGYAEPVAYYADDGVGYYADDYTTGYYADDYTTGYYAEPPYGSQWGEPDVASVGYYAEDQPPMGYYADEYYGDGQEMVGWGEPETPMGYYGETPFEGYVRDVPPTFNAGCPMPANVAGYGEPEHFEGYVKPSTVNATCENFKPQPGTAGEVPETFRPLW